LESSGDNADMVQMQLGSTASASTDYYYYDDSDGQKWLANMSFSIAGLDYAKIMASGPLHFGVLWNIKSEIASGLGVPFENVSIFLSDAGNLNIAAVVVGPWMTKLDPTPADIDIHLLDRIKAIPDIDSAKTDGFTADLRLSVSTRRHDDGLWTTTTTTTSDGRRRRSPATHSPTAAPAMCMTPYMGNNVVPGGQNTAAGVAVAFSCADDTAGKNTKYPLTGKVTCVAGAAGSASWGPYTSGGTDVTNWGCGADHDCWELPWFQFPTAGGQKVYPQADGLFKVGPVPGAVTAPFPPVAKGGTWCGTHAAQTCCATSTNVLWIDIVAGTPKLVDATMWPTCAATGGDYTDKSVQIAPTAWAAKGTNTAHSWVCKAPR
jgi:hypothetical protein